MEPLTFWSAAACRRFALRKSCPLRKREQAPALQNAALLLRLSAQNSASRGTAFALFRPVRLFWSAPLLQRGNTVKDGCGTKAACLLDRFPILPFWGKILVFGQPRFLQIVGQGIGQLNLQLL